MAVTGVGVGFAGVTGGVPVAVAVFATCPASTSPCVRTYETVQDLEAPTASAAVEQVAVLTLASEKLIGSSVTLPVFFTMNVYAMVSPAALPVGTPACLSRVSWGSAGIGVSTASVEVTSTSRVVLK